MMHNGNGPKKPQRRERRPPSIPTPESLALAALAYVARFASTEAALRRVLKNRIRKAAMVLPVFAADKQAIDALHRHIETLIEKHRRMGAVDDAAYAGMKAGSLRRAGRSKRFIQQKLAQKGVAQGLAAEALLRSDAEQGDDAAELAAAITFARRKRLGRFRMAKKIPDADQQRKQTARDLSAMARNGFAFTTAKQALGESGDEFTESD